MQGVTTQVSALKISTDCTIYLKKNTDTRGAAPSLMRILVNLCHTSHALARFMTTAGQSSSADDITCPNYLKEVTIPRGCPYALKALDVTALSASSTRHCLFLYSPFFHCSVRQCIPFRSLHGTNTSGTPW